MFEDVLLISIGIIGLIIATITDLKHREVPDYLNYFLIIFGLGFRAFYASLFNQWYYFFYGLLGLGAGFLIGLVLYITKQWGGGDTKLLSALGVIFATKPFFIKDDGLFLLNLFLNIFIVGALYGVFYGIYLAFKNKKNFINEFKKILQHDNIKFIKKLSLIIVVISLLLILISKDLATRFILLGFTIFIIFYIYLWVFVKAVENVCMFKVIPVNKLTEGDWVVDDVIVHNKLIYKKDKLAVDKNDILKFMKEGVKRVKIKNGVPFVPSFLIGTLLSLIFGSIFY